MSNNANSTFLRPPKGKGKGQGRGRTNHHRPDHSRDRSRPRPSSSNTPRPSYPKGRGKSKPSGNRGNTTPTDNRKPRDVTPTKPPTGDPCTYCGRTNYNGRNCYKRQEDEKKKSPGTHKQAHQSILVDETAFQFSQSVLSIYHSDFQNNPHHHGNDWGEQTQEQEYQQEQDVTEEEQQWANDELYQDITSDETTLVSSSASKPSSISTLTVANTKEDSDTEYQQLKDASHATPIEPEVTTTLKEPHSLKDTPTDVSKLRDKHRNKTSQKKNNNGQTTNYTKT